MLKGFYVLMIPLLVGMSLTSCGGQEEWDEDFYAFQWSSSIDACKEATETYTGRSDGYFTTGDSPTKMTESSRNKLASSSWFLKNGWSAIDGSHEWKRVIENFSAPRWTLEYSVCVRDLVTVLWIEPEEFWRCVWDSIEGSHTQEDWSYYSKSESREHLEEGSEKCITKFDRS